MGSHNLMRFIFFCALTFYSFYIFANDNDLVRVRILSEQKSFAFEGEAIVFNGQREDIIPVAIPQFSKWKVQIVRKGDDRFWLASQIYPTVKKTIYRVNQNLNILGKNIGDGKNEWPGSLRLIAGKQDQFDLISVLPLKSYLVGVLNGEMPKDWPLETLKSQAVASRSYVRALMKERKNKNFDVESDVRDQVFTLSVSGLESEIPVTQQQRAVKETQDLSLTFQNKIIKAYFHSDCGGEPASVSSVWGHQGHPTSRKQCFSERKLEWTYQIGKDELFEKMKSIWSSFDKDQFISFKWLRLPSLQRISSVEIDFKSGKNLKISSQEFRKLLGYTNLKSTLFQVRQENDQYIFTGTGYGHGVGLCQYGAKAMGKLGYSYQQILSHYYPETKLEKTKNQNKKLIRDLYL